MAFNFNWSPLAADADFYRRAKDLLTTALNKSPKPPIIVDDILVSDFNLGSVPPDLSILEIGDLAEDRFRGIFKMCYSGDALVTLRTRVQANPMNTYVGSTSSFTSPEPLAAADGLTIPLSITLSHFRLSAFIIVVYSKHKGVTIVFRNDPLESLKVSSTFDSIQFVRDYLQRTIEDQLRTLIMDELPSIIHRLSLQMFCHRTIHEDDDDGEAEINPLASPPSDPVDSNGNLLGEAEITALSLDESGEPTFQFESLFSNLNLLRLKKVAAAHEFLSTFTPSLREMHYRAVDSDLAESSGSSTPQTPAPALTKTNSFAPTTTNTYSFSETASNGGGSNPPTRPSLTSLGSATTTGLALGAGRSRTYTTRKRKHRVVNLRRSRSEAGSSAASEAGGAGDTASIAADVMSEPLVNGSIPEESVDEPTQQRPILEVLRRREAAAAEEAERSAQLPPAPMPMPDAVVVDAAPEKAAAKGVADLQQQSGGAPTTAAAVAAAPTAAAAAKAAGGGTRITYPWEKAHQRAAASASSTSVAPSDAPSGVLEQAWIAKFASEIARRVYDEKNRRDGLWADREDSPPPAYEASG